MAKKKRKAVKKSAKKPARPRVVLIAFDADAMIEMACRAVFEDGKASTSLIQRRLKIGYSRAAALLDQLEELKLIGPMDGSKPRTLIGSLPTLKRGDAPVPAAEEKKKNKGGRPTIFNEKLATTLCTRLAHGESLRQICRDEDMPAISTVMDWLLDEKKEDFHKLYERARNLQTEVLFDETLEIADDGTNDWYDHELDNGHVIRRFDHEHAQRSKLRVDTRKWFISKVQPKKYGEKLDLSSGGKPLKAAAPAVINYIVPKEPKAA